MIIINNVDENHFTLNDIEYAKIYQPLAQGSEAIGIYSIYDTRQQLVNSAKYTEFVIDDVIGGTQEATMSLILDVVWSALSESDFEELSNEIDQLSDIVDTHEIEINTLQSEVGALDVRVDNLEENQYSGVEVYSTYADLPAMGTLLVSYKVSNDPDNTKNGYYHWSGSVYIKDADIMLDNAILENDLDANSNEIVNLETDMSKEEGAVNVKSLPVYNVTTSIPLGGGSYYTIETAIAAIPIDVKKLGMKITLEASAGVWLTLLFKGTDLNYWSLLKYWETISEQQFEKDLINELTPKTKEVGGANVSIDGVLTIPVGQIGFDSRTGFVLPTTIRKIRGRVISNVAIVGNLYYSTGGAPTQITATALSVAKADGTFHHEFQVEIEEAPEGELTFSAQSAAPVTEETIIYFDKLYSYDQDLIVTLSGKLSSDYEEEVKESSIVVYRDNVYSEAVVGSGITKEGYYDQKAIADNSTTIRFGVTAEPENKIIDGILQFKSNKEVGSFFTTGGTISSETITSVIKGGYCYTTIDFESDGLEKVFLQETDIEIELLNIKLTHELSDEEFISENFRSVSSLSLGTFRDFIYSKAVVGSGLVLSGIYNQKAEIDAVTTVRFGIEGRADNKITDALIVIKSSIDIPSASSFFDNFGTVTDPDYTSILQEDGSYICTLNYSSAGSTLVFTQQSNATLELIELAINTEQNFDKNAVVDLPDREITVARFGVAGVDADFVGNNAIQDAIDSITDADKNNVYNIRISAGVYSIDAAVDFNGSGIAYYFVSGKDYVNVIGSSKNDVFIMASLPDNLGTSFDYDHYQTVYWQCEAILSGVTVVAQNIRYAVHVDSVVCVNKTGFIKNSRLEHKGNTNDALVVWQGQYSLGLGTFSGQRLTIEDCELISPIGGVGSHNNENFDINSIVKYIRCKIWVSTDNIGNVLSVPSFGSMTNDQIVLEDCVLEESYFNISDSPRLNLDLEDQVSDHAETEIICTDMNPRAIRSSTLKGKGLKITSKNSGASSTIRFDETSTAFDSIIGNSTFATLIKNRYRRNEIHGYSYKDGLNGLSGFAIGGLDIGEYGLGITQDYYLTPLGKRLGDCSTVNKTLTVIIDGTPYNIVFNKDYDGTAAGIAPNYTNAQIIIEIEAVIGAFATVEEYAVAKDYYPQFNNVDYMINADTEEVLSGMGIVFISQKTFRKATNSDGIIDGICLDDGGVDDICRIIKAGDIYSQVSGERFSLKEESSTTRNFGDKLGISTSNTGVFDAVTPYVLTTVQENILRIIK